MAIDAIGHGPHAKIPTASLGAAIPARRSGDTVEPRESSAASATRAVAEHIRNYLRESGRELDFRIDADTGRMVVTVRDPVSGESFRQIPAEEVLQIARHLRSPIERLVDMRA